MSYLKFDKNLMINLQESLSREILRTNRIGAYHCTTIVDCNTRKYHGLLVIPLNINSNENHVLLSSLDETVIQHGAEFNLGLHKYEGNNFSPKGHKYIREYTCDNVPRTVYRVGGVILSKSKVFALYNNQIMIKYSLLDAHSETILRFRPFLAFRSVNELTYENGAINRKYDEIPNGIKTALYPGYPELHMQFNKPAKFIYEPYWYKGIEYPKEQERGYPYKEDLYVPGYFEIPIKKGESIWFSASDIEVDPKTLQQHYEAETESRTPRTSFYNCLKNSAQQFYFRPKEQDAYLLAGYPWFKVRARDLFISLPGCTLGIDDPGRFEKIMNTAIPAIRKFITKGEPDMVIQEIDLPDITGWAIWAIQQYAKNVGLDVARKNYKGFVEECVNYIYKNRHPLLRLEDNGLLYANGRKRAISWMNSTIKGMPAVPRTGYLVEFNALWYNTLCFYKELSGGIISDEYEELISKIEKSFTTIFINKYNYLYDFVNGTYVDWSVRPNMLFAASLDYSPLNKMQKRAVLDIVTKELLTPKGLRSLSPKSEGYLPNYTGNQSDRDKAYHHGTAWPWLFGAYLETYLKIFGRGGVSFVQRMLISIEDSLSLHCLGTISELFDGAPPFIGRGAISFAMNVGEILRILDLLSHYNEE